MRYRCARTPHGNALRDRPTLPLLRGLPACGPGTYRKGRLLAPRWQRAAHEPRLHGGAARRRRRHPPVLRTGDCPDRTGSPARPHPWPWRRTRVSGCRFLGIGRVAGSPTRRPRAAAAGPQPRRLRGMAGRTPRRRRSGARAGPRRGHAARRARRAAGPGCRPRTPARARGVGARLPGCRGGRAAADTRRFVRRGRPRVRRRRTAEAARAAGLGRRCRGRSGRRLSASPYGWR